MIFCYRSSNRPNFPLTVSVECIIEVLQPMIVKPKPSPITASPEAHNISCASLGHLRTITTPQMSKFYFSGPCKIKLYYLVFSYVFNINSTEFDFDLMVQIKWMTYMVQIKWLPVTESSVHFLVFIIFFYLPFYFF